MFAISIMLFVVAAGCVAVALLGGKATMLVVASIVFFIAMLALEQYGRDGTGSRRAKTAA